jgi:hypothetical protein
MTGALAVNGNLTVDTNTLFVDAASNNVGIGTSSPATILALRASAPTISFITTAGEDTSASIEGSVDVGTGGKLVFITKLNGSIPTEKMRIDSAGRVTMPYQPCFLAYGSKSKDLGWQQVSDAFTTTKYNVGNHYNTSNGRFTAPIGGVYCFYAGGYSPNTGNGVRYAWSATINAGPQEFIAGGDYLNVDSPLAGYLVFHTLSAGDFVQLEMFSEIVATIGNSTHDSYFGGYLIG